MTTFKTFLNNERNKAIDTKREEFADWLQEQVTIAARAGFSSLRYNVGDLPEEYQVATHKHDRAGTQEFLETRFSGCKVEVRFVAFLGDIVRVTWNEEPEQETEADAEDADQESGNDE